MKVSNIRFGFATNSSSMHSLVFNLELSEDDQTTDWFDQKFGWEEFLCYNEPGKRAYFCQVIYQNLVHEIGHELAAAVAKQWTNFDVQEDGYIDHQSLMALPRNFKSKMADETFFKELLEWHLRPEVAIVGGNDNTDEDYVPKHPGTRHSLLLPKDTREQFICRKDRLNQYWWTLFNKHTGAKLRLSFHNDAPNYSKSFAPELVDIKITDHCGKGCHYCYQSSSKDGKHADMDYIRSLCYALSDLEVFEVALGGGEPTDHPEFIEILKTFHYYGITPNFTTKSLEWLEDPKIVKAVNEYCGRFAYSAVWAHDIHKVTHIAKFLGVADNINDHKLSIQHVMGTCNQDEFRNLCIATNDCGLDLTLLGYKKVGKGKGWEPYPYDKWLATLEDTLHYSRVGIDTTLATLHKEELLAIQQPIFFTFDEGKFSMYIDAVEKKAAQSSFVDPKKFVDLSDIHKSPIDKVFSQF